MSFDLNGFNTELETAILLHAPSSLLRESILYSALAPGKRFRPRLLLASGHLFGMDSKLLLPAALALEMLHCFTLIHDDLPSMDNDDFRRNQPTNHKRFGESMALLAGDALIPLAVQLFLTTTSSLAIHSGLNCLMTCIGTVIQGQALEIQTSSPSWSLLQEIQDQKTGALFHAALLIPYLLQGSPTPTQESILTHFAQTLGRAFQIADDAEDENPSQDPKNALFYLPAQELFQKTQKNILFATHSIQQEWPESASPILEISHEILHKLKISLKP